MVAFLQSVLQGNLQACLNLADMLQKGIGIGKPNLKSAKRYELLARKLLADQEALKE